ncbi:MAG: nucleotidyltransferase domain-containing protein [Bacteroidetes bacterium]|nr:nucleotidyltransferase domain-containing protein [Bacteroidota bacterium]
MSTIVEILKQEKRFLHDSFGVEQLAVFGSYARGNENEESDIDILVTLDKPDYSKFSGLYSYLRKKFNKKIDLIRMGDHITEKFLSRIKKDVIYV